VFPTLSEILKAFYGTLLLARRHPAAPTMFDCTPAGFWRAILGQVLAIPAYVAITVNAVHADPDTTYTISDGIVDVLIHAIVLLGYPAIMDHITHFLGRRDRLVDYLVPYLWASIPINYLIAAVTISAENEALAPGFRVMAGFLVYSFALFLHWEIARRQLSVGGLMAFGIMVFELFFTVAVMSILASFALRG